MPSKHALKIGAKCTLTRKINHAFKSGKWTWEIALIKVRLMAIAEGYAMVRRPRAFPFVVSLDELEAGEHPDAE